MSKRVRIAFLTCAVLFGCSGIILLSLGLISQQDEKIFVTTSQTTAVVSDKEIKTHEQRQGSGPQATTRTVQDFWVYLDFSYSDMGKEWIALLNQRQQGIELRYKEDYDSFHVGQYVTIVYRTPESVHEKVCIESVDGCEVWWGSGDLTVPREEATWPIFYFVLGGLFLTIAGLSIVGYYHDAIDDYVKQRKYPFGSMGRYYFNRAKIILKALGKSFITLFFAGFFPLIMIVYGGDIGNWLLVIIGWLVFAILFYLIGRWKLVGLWEAWRKVFSETGRKQH